MLRIAIRIAKPLQTAGFWFGCGTSTSARHTSEFGRTVLVVLVVLGVFLALVVVALVGVQRFDTQILSGIQHAMKPWEYPLRHSARHEAMGVASV